MELKGRDLLNYGLLRDYAKYDLERDSENSNVHKWVEEIRRESPDAWEKAKEEYDIYKYW